MTTDPPVSGARPRPEFRGLPSIEQARADRRRASPKPWTWGLIVALAGLVAWWKFDAARLGEERTALLSRQREVAARLGPNWSSLETRVEAWTAACAAGRDEKKNPELAKSWDFRGLPGIYLRLGKKDADNPESIRAAAEKSLHDGFTSCLFTADNPSPLGGEKCETTQDCAPGQLCNEFRQCAPPGQPFNLRIAYRATHVLTDGWVAEVQAMRNDLELRGALQSLDALEKYDLPLAADLLARSKYLLVVVDDPVEGGEIAPEPATGASAVPPTDERGITASPHRARVCLWRLSDGARMLALGLDASAELKGDHPMDEATRRALQRQAGGCDLALQVRQAIGALGAQ